MHWKGKPKSASIGRTQKAVRISELEQVGGKHILERGGQVTLASRRGRLSGRAIAIDGELNEGAAKIGKRVQDWFTFNSTLNANSKLTCPVMVLRSSVDKSVRNAKNLASSENNWKRSTQIEKSATKYKSIIMAEHSNVWKENFVSQLHAFGVGSLLKQAQVRRDDLLLDCTHHLQRTIHLAHFSTHVPDS